MKLSPIIVALALTTTAASTYASSVTVTADFSQFTMGSFASAAATFNNQLSMGRPLIFAVVIPPVQVRSTIPLA